MGSKDFRIVGQSAGQGSTAASGPQFWASPTGGGNGLSASSPELISDFLNNTSQAVGGATLNLLDGTYTGANSMINPPAAATGHPGNPITIRAVNDGNVTLDGGAIFVPVKGIQGTDYYNISGINAHNSKTDVFQIQRVYGWNVRRCLGWDAGMGSGDGDGNAYPFAINYGSYNLVEDCGAWGIGRKMCISYSNPGPNTYRRFWGRCEKSLVYSPHIGASIAYNSYNTLFENMIMTWDTTPMPASYTMVDYGQVPTHTSSGSTTLSGNGGSITAGQTTMNVASNAGFPTSVPFLVYVPNSNGETIKVTSVGGGTNWTISRGYAGSTATSHNDTDPVLAVSNTCGAGTVQGDSTCLITNKGFDQAYAPISADGYNTGTTNSGSRLLGSISYMNAGAIHPGNYEAVAYLCLFSGGIEALTLKDVVAIYPNTGFGAGYQTFGLFNGTLHTGSTATNCTSFKGLGDPYTSQADWTKVNFVEATTPSALYVGQGESLYNTSQGAQIKFCYVNGVLTSTRLFPWPMGARIKAATLASGYAQADVDATIQGMFGTYS